MIRSRCKRGIWVACVIAGVWALGCKKSAPTNPSGEGSVASTSSDQTRTPTDVKTPAPSCGHEVQRHGAGYDATARTCLWNAYLAGQTASLALTRHTIEGDPITFTLRVISASSIEVIEDNRDRFGARGVRKSICEKLERTAETTERSGFVLTGCAGATPKIEFP